ncbi:hypothetical protein J6S46_01920, partial [Candidatus Saccharibacteria bacterium]|nr:hypothetical protein [Candidatus Saccharibacteria bacterium]
ICQIYLPSFHRSYGKEAFNVVTQLLSTIKKAGFAGLYLIALWCDGGYDNGFDIIDYSPNPKFGTPEQLARLIERAHDGGLTVGVDVVPNHVSDENILAQNCLNDVEGYEDVLYVVSREEAQRLASAGVPSFFGRLAYSDFGDKYVRSSFADYHQLNLNWRSQKVQAYFATLFRRLKAIGIDFVRVDCGMMLLEDVSKASKEDPFACLNPKASIAAIRQVSGGMPLFFEWFDPSTADLFDNLPECYALDCSYVVTGKQNTDWCHPKIVPLLGGHDQMTAADRGLDIDEALEKMEKFDYGFLDIQTLVGWKTDPAILSTDKNFDADLKNPNQRYRGRRPVSEFVTEFVCTFN